MEGGVLVAVIVRHNTYLKLIAWLLIYVLAVLATRKFIAGWMPTCKSAHTWQVYSNTPLGNHYSDLGF